VIESKIIGCVSCAQVPNPPQGAKVTFCEKCRKSVWISTSQVKLKQSQKFPIWCEKCVNALGQQDNTEIIGVQMDKDESVDSIVKKLSEITDDDGNVFEWIAKKVGKDFDWAEKLRKVEEQIFLRMSANIDQNMARTEEFMPKLLKILMPRLKIYECLEDLAIATTLQTIIENMLCKRRETLGPGKVFSGFTMDESITLLVFMVGVSKAVEHSKDKGVEGLSHASQEEFVKGTQDWWDKFFEGFGEEIDDFKKRYDLGDLDFGSWPS
jgi:hypothetical protein